MIIHDDDCVVPSIFKKWDKLLTNYDNTYLCLEGKKIVEFGNILK